LFKPPCELGELGIKTSDLTRRAAKSQRARSAAMARARVMSLLCACGLAAMLAIAVGSAALSFVGAPAMTSPRLRALQY